MVKTTTFVTFAILILIIIAAVVFIPRINSNNTQDSQDEQISSTVIENQALIYCDAVQSLDLNQCTNFDLLNSSYGASMEEECVKNILLKNFIFDNINLCKDLSETTNLKKEECETTFNKIANPDLETNLNLKNMFEAFNEKNVSKCELVEDSDYCKFILDENYDCNSDFLI